MPRGKKGKKSGPRSEPSRGKDRAVQGTSVKSRRHLASAAVLSPRKGTQAGRRSKTSSGPLANFQDDPDRILRKRYKISKATESAQVQDRPQQSVETVPAEGQPRIDDSALYDYSKEASSPLGLERDPEELFYRSWGYLPPLDEYAAALIEAIMEDPSKAKDASRINPEKPAFDKGLRYRNVLMTESTDADPYVEDTLLLKRSDFVPEPANFAAFEELLWTMDQAKCNEGSNEALFQRTIMMSLIVRHHWIYHPHPNNMHHLDFSVEETWTCPPMPTRAYSKGEPFLTQPKPDLAICFRRQTLIPDDLWDEMPTATQRLACYEDADHRVKMEKIFHFFTIEAKKAETIPGDSVGMRQSLNNASQALHNMFEFFRDAGTKHEELFFEKVRFFSGVASTQGLIVRIHRATRVRDDGSGQGFIIKDRPDYPLRFEHRVISDISKKEFNRKTVYEKLENILFGYGVGELHKLLLTAAEALMKKLNDSPQAKWERENKEFYRYEQIQIKPSRRPTPATRAGSRAESTQNCMPPNMPQGAHTSGMAPPPGRGQSETNTSANMPGNDMTTPQIEVIIPRKTPSKTHENISRKRPSGQVGQMDTGSERAKRRHSK